jgi:hypothetical protein
LKIGILTFQATRNYGANLQAFALQKTIEGLGVPCEIIDYRCRAVDERERVKTLSDMKTPKGVIRWFVSYAPEKRREQVFRQFRKRHLKLSEKSYDRQNIQESNEAYDCFLVGSDQIWNLVLTEGDFSFFLDFIQDDRRKASYAASFGYCVVPKPYRDECRAYLQKFRHLSVRETQASRIVRELTGESVPVVLDPVFLLGRQAWYQFCKMPPLDENYILVYFLHNEKSTLRFARELSKREHCKIIYINLGARPQPFVKNLRAPTPSQFLNLIKNARYVITGSFHGAAFSVYFQKQFFLDYAKEENNFNSRMESLMSLLGIGNRHIPDGGSTAVNVIDYSLVEPKLEFERQKSIQFLKDVIKDYESL